MKTRYRVTLPTAVRVAAAELDPGGDQEQGLWWLTWIWVNPQHRHRGIGRALLSNICRDADAEDIILGLTALTGVPDRRGYDEDGVSLARLEKLYMSVGFVTNVNRTRFMAEMIRRPHGRETHT